MSIEELIGRYPNLEVCRGSLEAAYKTLEECFAGGGKLLIAGNGGSAADSDHIVGELMKGFVKRRPLSEELKQALAAADPVRGKELAEKLQEALPAIALTNHAALSSAFANDVGRGFKLCPAGERLWTDRRCIPWNQHFGQCGKRDVRGGDGQGERDAGDCPDGKDRRKAGSLRRYLDYCSGTGKPTRSKNFTFRFTMRSA